MLKSKKSQRSEFVAKTTQIMTYSEFRGCIDELELDLLEITTGGVDHEGFSDGDDSLLRSGDGALQHDVVVLDDTVMGEATHGCDPLLGDIVLGGSIAIVVACTDTVNLLVELRSVVVTV